MCITLQAAATLAVKTFENEAPVEYLSAMKAYHEAYNTPTMGCDNNYYFSSMQLNLAAGQHGDSGEFASNRNNIVRN